MLDNDYARLAFAVARWRHFGELPANIEILLEPIPDGYAEGMYGPPGPSGRRTLAGLEVLDPTLRAVTGSIPRLDAWSATVDLGPEPDAHPDGTRVDTLVFREERRNERISGQRLLWVMRARRGAPGDDLELDYIMDPDWLPGRLTA